MYPGAVVVEWAVCDAIPRKLIGNLFLRTLLNIFFFLSFPGAQTATDRFLISSNVLFFAILLFCWLRPNHITAIFCFSIDLLYFLFF